MPEKFYTDKDDVMHLERRDPNLCDRHAETITMMRKLDERVGKLELSEASIVEKLSNLLVGIGRIEGVVERSLQLHEREFERINSRLLKVSGGAILFLGTAVMWYIQNRSPAL